jgi:hypothetical protein
VSVCVRGKESDRERERARARGREGEKEKLYAWLCVCVWAREASVSSIDMHTYVSTYVSMCVGVHMLIYKIYIIHTERHTH